MLYVSHSQDEVARLADHLVLLSNGKALASGPIGQTLARLDLPLALGDDAGVVLRGASVPMTATINCSPCNCPTRP